MAVALNGLQSQRQSTGCIHGGAEQSEGVIARAGTAGGVDHQDSIGVPVESQTHLVPAGSGRPAAPGDVPRPRPLREVISESESNHITYVLELTGGNRSRTSEILEISRKSLWEKMKAYGLL